MHHRLEPLILNGLNEGINEGGTVNLLDRCWDRAQLGWRALGYAAAVTPVTSAQTWKAWVRAARYGTAGI